MKNNELVAMVIEAVEKRFAGRQVKITVTPIKHNGVSVCVKDEFVNRNGDKEFNQIGQNLTVYAVAGKENILNKINNWYK